jgi:hypothetical protein
VAPVEKKDCPTFGRPEQPYLDGLFSQAMTDEFVETLPLYTVIARFMRATYFSWEEIGSPGSRENARPCDDGGR